MLPDSQPKSCATRRRIVLALSFVFALCAVASSPVVFAAGAPVNAPLADAAEKADWPRVATLLKDHADVNALQTDGMTAIHWAAYHDNLESAKLLLAAGADAKAENHYNVTPLSLACTNGNGEMVKAAARRRRERQHHVARR